MLKLFVFDQLNVVWTSQFGDCNISILFKVSKYCQAQVSLKIFFVTVYVSVVYILCQYYWQNITNYTKTLYR